MRKPRERVCHVCSGSGVVEGQMCLACGGTGRIAAHPWSRKQLEKFRDEATRLVLEEIEHSPFMHNYRSEIGRWVIAIYSEFAGMLRSGLVTGRRYYRTEKQLRECIASLGPTPVSRTMRKIFGKHARTKTAMGYALKEVFPHETKQAIKSKKRTGGQ